MKKKCGVGLVILVALVAVGFLLGYLAPAHPQESRCAQGDALRTARLLDEARNKYADGGCAALQGVELTEAEAERHFAAAFVYASTDPGNTVSSKRAIDNFAAGLALDPFDSGANTGLTRELNKKVVRPEVQCETGAHLVGDGLLTVAGVALANGLAAGIEWCETALTALGAQQTTASRHLIEARKLDDIAEGRKEYAEALTANANLVAARTGLEESLNDESCLDEIGSWFADVPETLKTALLWLIPLAVGIFAFLLLLWIAVREASVRWRWARKASERLGKHPGLSFFRKAAVPDINVEPFGGKGESALVGADFAVLLKGEIFKSTARGPAFPFDRVPGDPSPLPKTALPSSTC